MSAALGAASVDTELHYRILNTSSATEPTNYRGVIMFSYSASPGTRMVALAFEHEQYGHLHRYERNPHGVFILTIPAPRDEKTIRYRLIVDGLWTTDPHSPTVTDQRGIPVSTYVIQDQNGMPKPGVENLPDGRIRFVYIGESGSRVSLVGDFNRWDPFLTPMPESLIHAGVYELVMSIPPGARHYRYIVDGHEVPDPENPAVTRNGWGEKASVLP